MSFFSSNKGEGAIINFIFCYEPMKLSAKTIFSRVNSEKLKESFIKQAFVDNFCLNQEDECQIRVNAKWFCYKFIESSSTIYELLYIQIIACMIT